MKIPSIPPNTQQLMKQVLQKDQSFWLDLFSQGSAEVSGKYLHWEKLQYYPCPEGLTHEEWWLSLKLSRLAQYRVLPLRDKKNRSFQYLLLDSVLRILHETDIGAGGVIQMPDQITNNESRDRYYIHSLIEEAITSSQLEGATTTRLVAKEMIRTGRPPRDKSEQMIYNNFLTMQRIGQIKDQPLSRELVLEIHRMVTEKTLEDPSAAGRFRRKDEHVYVGDDYDTVYHEPPDADELEERIEQMCQFANDEPSEQFIPPVVRSIILHFWLAYDHPFVDGNGRTARALFYWSMLRHGFWLFEFISISRILHNAPSKYARAFLYTETDDNDLTYFIIYHLDVIQRAIADLHEYIQRKTREIHDVEKRLKGMAFLNYRQQALVSHALRHPDSLYTIESHRLSHNVVYGTARNDLLDLRKNGLLTAFKVGKNWHFQPVPDLEQRLAERR